MQMFWSLVLGAISINTIEKCSRSFENNCSAFVHDQQLKKTF